MFKNFAFIVFIIAFCNNNDYNVWAQDDDAHAHVEKYYNKGDRKGHFEFGYDITNGIGADESGDEKAVHGEYHFITKEGVPVKVSYTADDQGFHPQSDLLPTPPPTPEAILKALAYIAAHPPKQKEENEGHNKAKSKHN